MAIDWTYDLFMDDAENYKATPQKGVYCRANATDREKFMVWFKNQARDFLEEWEKSHSGVFDKYDGYIGDRFAETFDKILFSDYYKDVFGQRPHLAKWFYVKAVKFPHSEDISRTFCAHPISYMIDDAKENRKYMENLR